MPHAFSRAVVTSWRAVAPIVRSREALDVTEGLATDKSGRRMDWICDSGPLTCGDFPPGVLMYFSTKQSVRDKSKTLVHSTTKFGIPDTDRIRSCAATAVVRWVNWMKQRVESNAKAIPSIPPKYSLED